MAISKTKRFKTSTDPQSLLRRAKTYLSDVELSQTKKLNALELRLQQQNYRAAFEIIDQLRADIKKSRVPREAILTTFVDFCEEAERIVLESEEELKKLEPTTTKVSVRRVTRG